MRTVILASSSPRRKALLEQTSLKFTVVPSNYNEEIEEKLTPDKLAEKLSLGKAKDVFSKHQNTIIIAADTLVVCDGKILGKPKDKKDAEKMLKFLSGKVHSLITGFTIIDENHVITKSEETKIHMREITNSEIDLYLQTEEPYDKAGAYAIQGEARKFIIKIEGDFKNAVGLPINTILRELKTLGAF